MVDELEQKKSRLDEANWMNHDCSCFEGYNVGNGWKEEVAMLNAWGRKENKTVNTLLSREGAE
jgi:hypothetical protein